MFANAFQTGFLSIFYSVGSSPLSIWDKQVKNGHIRRIVDDEVKSLVLELSGTNVATTYITTPIKPRASLGIRLPFLVLIVKNMKKYFTFEIQILDDKDMHRRFRVSNFQSTTKVRPFCTTMPIGLSTGWNQIQFNLADFTRRAYGTVYIETMRVQIHANARIRRIYFSDRLYSDEEMPNEYKLFMPTQGSEQRRSSKEPTAVQKKMAEPGEAAKPTAATAEAASKTETLEMGVEDIEPIDVSPARDEGDLQGAAPTPVESELTSPEVQEEEGEEPTEAAEEIDGAEPASLSTVAADDKDVNAEDKDIKEPAGDVVVEAQEGAEAEPKEGNEEGGGEDAPSGTEVKVAVDEASAAEEGEAAASEVDAGEIEEMPVSEVAEE